VFFFCQDKKNTEGKIELPKKLIIAKNSAMKKR
jgi:hypothetical protein